MAVPSSSTPHEPQPVVPPPTPSMSTSHPLARRSFVKGVGLAALAVSGAPLLSACSSGSSGGSSSGGATKTIEFWWNASVESSAPMSEWLNGLIKKFEAANAGTKVNAVVQPPEQLVGNFRTACQSKSGPSLDFQYAGAYTMQFVWLNCAHPLDDLVGKDELSHISPQIGLDEYRYQGKLWALPWYNAPITLMYNKKLFEKAGLDRDAPPKTVDELMAMAQKLRASGTIPWGYGLKNLTGIGNFSGLFNMQTLDNAKEILQPALGNVPYTDPKYSQWLRVVKQLIDAKVFNDDVTSLQYQDSQNMFLAGKSAICVSSSLTQFHKELKDDLGVMTPPKWGTGAIAGRMSINPTPLFITSFAEHKEETAKFLKYLHTADALTGMYKASGFFPADDRFPKETIQTPQDRQLYDMIANQSTIGYQNFWPAQMDRENVFLGVQSLFSGSSTPESAAKDIDDRLAQWRKTQATDLKNFQAWAQG